MKSVLSVDVAKGKSMIMLSTEYGEVLIEPKEIKHNFRDFIANGRTTQPKHKNKQKYE